MRDFIEKHYKTIAWFLVVFWTVNFIVDVWSKNYSYLVLDIIGLFIALYTVRD